METKEENTKEEKTMGAQVDNEEKKGIFLSDEDIMDVSGGVCMGHGVAESEGTDDSYSEPGKWWYGNPTGKGNYNDQSR